MSKPQAPNWQPWNKGVLVGRKRALRPKDVWSIRVRLEIAGASRDLAVFDLAIDSKLRACDLVRLKVNDVCIGGRFRSRATVVQKKTQRPVQFEIGEQARKTVEAWIPKLKPGNSGYLFRAAHDEWTIFQRDSMHELFTAGSKALVLRLRPLVPIRCDVRKLRRSIRGRET